MGQWTQLPKREKREKTVKKVQDICGDWTYEIQSANIVEASGVSNAKGCKIPVRSKLNIENWEKRLEHYHDKEVLEYQKYGWPIGSQGFVISERRQTPNHGGANEYSHQVDNYLIKETDAGSVMGPFDNSPFEGEVCVSPLNTKDKRDTQERRVILDLSFPHGDSVNDSIDKETYMGKIMDLHYPTVDTLAEKIYQKGKAKEQKRLEEGLQTMANLSR